MGEDLVAIPNKEGDGSFSIGSDVWPGASKAIEEMGECLQIMGKLIATHGNPVHWNRGDLREDLEDEISDVLAALNFFSEMNGLNRKKIKRRHKQKLEKFWEWQRTQARG